MPNLSHQLEAAFKRSVECSQPVQFMGPLVVRLTLGVVFSTSGWGKLHNLEQVTTFFTELGIPAPAFHAVFIANLELIAGALLCLGLLSRLAAIPLLCTMCVALLTAQLPELNGVAELLGTSEFAYLAMLLWITLAGPGAASLDALLTRRRSAVSHATEPAVSHAV